MNTKIHEGHEIDEDYFFGDLRALRGPSRPSGTFAPFGDLRTLRGSSHPSWIFVLSVTFEASWNFVLQGGLYA
jgi:hypothetical protein